MSNKAAQVLHSIRVMGGVTVHDTVIRACGAPEKTAASQEQAQRVRVMLHEVERAYGRELVVRIMKRCGHQCIPPGMVARAREMFEESQDLEAFLGLLNEQHIGGGRLRTEQGKIIAVYEDCYCEFARRVRGLPPAYCNCSAGWFEHLFCSVFEREVEARYLQTVVDGSDKCVFEISI